MWSTEELTAAIIALATRVGASKGIVLPPPPVGLAESDIAEWLHRSATAGGVELVEQTVADAELETFLRAPGAALLRVAKSPSRFLVVSGARAGHVVLLAQDLTEHRLPLAEVAEQLRLRADAPVERAIDEVLDAANIGAERRAISRKRMLEKWLTSSPRCECWLVRLPAGSSFIAQLRAAGLLRVLAVFTASWIAWYAGWIASWWLVGRDALEGRSATGWLSGWALLLITLVPLRLLADWAQGTLSIGLGGLFRIRTFAGTFRLDRDEIDALGAGQLLGRVLDAGMFEGGVLNGGFLIVVSILELCLAAWILAHGAGGAGQVILLVCWVAATFVFGWLTSRALERWTDARLALTGEMTENMVGYRTRLAQSPREEWHRREDAHLDRLVRETAATDRAICWLSILTPQTWLMVAMILLVPGLTSGRSVTATAVALAGMVLGRGALARLAASLRVLAWTAVAWRNASLLFRAASRPDVAGRPDLVGATHDPASGPLLFAEHLVYRQRRRGHDPVVRDCSLIVHHGDRVLLRGRSGSGKSTLSALLSGLREPDGGILLLDGLDRRTVGCVGWRKRVVVAPQFHENHIFAATLAFNLLMGRGWPPQPHDLADAEALCAELGLDALLARMPAGIWQKVGDIGWQLSHGERSLVFIARALLQRASVVIFDESFASLDPKTLDRALACAVRRAPTLINIMHT
jgi:ATP-binding cassette subfamily B protein